MECIAESAFKAEDRSPVDAPALTRKHQRTSRLLRSQEDEILELERPQQLELVRLRTPRVWVVKVKEGPGGLETYGVWTQKKLLR